MPNVKSPAYQFYPAEWIAGTRNLIAAEKGIFNDLLAYSWLEVGLPDDIEALARMVGEPIESFKMAWIKVSKKFIKRGKKLFNLRQERERRKQRNFSRMQRSKSLKYWTSGTLPSIPRDTNGKATESIRDTPRGDTSSSSSSSSTTVKQQHTAERPPAAAEYTISTPLQKSICAWKIITGVKQDDRAWDKMYFARHAKSANALLGFFGGDHKLVIYCMKDIYRELKLKQLDCTIETVVKRASEWKVKNEKRNLYAEPTV